MLLVEHILGLANVPPGAVQFFLYVQISCFLCVSNELSGLAFMPLDWTRGNLREGLRCFHSGAFFEAHEHWEAVWLAAQEPEKTLLQALIQVAASFHHLRRGNRAGTISLLHSARGRLDRYPEVFAGVVVAPLRVAIRSWLEALENAPHSTLPPIPSITLAGSEFRNGL